MRRKHESRVENHGRREVASAKRIARQIEASCRRRLPDCRVVTVLDGPGRSIDLRVGSRGGAPGDQLWVRDLDVDCLATAEAVDDLARVIRVWIEPEARVARRPQGRLAAGR